VQTVETQWKESSWLFTIFFNFFLRFVDGVEMVLAGWVMNKFSVEGREQKMDWGGWEDGA